MSKVLVAESNPLCMEGLSAILGQLFDPTAVLNAADFAGAVRHLSQALPVTLLVIDLTLPGLDDLDGVQRLRLQFPDVRIIAVAWEQDRNRALAALVAGAHGFVSKTLSSSDMLIAFRTVMEGQVYLPPTVADVGRQPPGEASPTSSLAPEVHLTVRQREVIQLLSAGRSNKQIARALSIAEGTVKVHMTAAFRTLGVHNRVSAAAAIRKLSFWREEEPFLPGLARTSVGDRRHAHAGG